ncbi:MAG TPA: BON domain-containing protein [Casimicrobiaceae bacterium]|nr:BON domain-containing protein [Casimicrobiaceae bacterium]
MMWQPWNRVLALVAAVMLLPLQGCVPLVVGAAAGGTALVATDPRTTGTQVDDEVIEDKISYTLHERFKGDFHINVTSYNGVVLLTGEVPAEQARADIAEIARTTPKVRAVQNELAIGPVTDMNSRTNDTLITSKVKTRFVEANKFQINHVKVVTERGTVYLMGLVPRSEADAAADIASTTSGVQRVVKVFEYLPG